jgi:uncharacterized membrane protein
MSAPTCALCGDRAASYVCQSCGRAVCGNCFSSPEWSCINCLGKIPQSPQGESMHLRFSWLSLLFFIAFAAIFVGILLMSFGSLSNLNGLSSGAIILIGPIPIVLGSGTYSLPLIALAAGLTAFGLVFFLLLRRRG